MPAVNEVFTAEVRDLTSDGSGVVVHDRGQVFFVAGVWPGETGEFRVTGFRKRNGYAELVRLLTPSPRRVAPPCPHQGFTSRSCGGCPWQFVHVEAQLEQKQQRVRQAMARLGLAELTKPIWPSPRSLGYRNRAQFKTDGRILGYVSAASNQLAAIEDCPILSDRNRQTLADLLAMLPNSAWRPRRRAQWTTIDIDEDVDAAGAAINRRRPFRQGNSEQNQRLRQWLADALTNADMSRPALELFAGSGNFTQVIAAAGFPRVVAAEGVAEAVAGLEGLALPAVSGLVVDLFDDNGVAALGRACGESGTLVLDPPRDGFRAMATLLAALPQLSRVAYISCDLATFTRDLAVLQGAGFTVTEVQPVDMFPHTPHVEVLAALVR